MVIMFIMSQNVRVFLPQTLPSLRFNHILPSISRSRILKLSCCDSRQASKRGFSSEAKQIISVIL